MNDIELARLKQRLRKVSKEAQEATETLRNFAAQCEEVSRIMQSIRESYTLAGVPTGRLSSVYKGNPEISSTKIPPCPAPKLSVINGGRPDTKILQ